MFELRRFSQNGSPKGLKIILSAQRQLPCAAGKEGDQVADIEDLKAQGQDASVPHSSDELVSVCVVQSCGVVVAHGDVPAFTQAIRYLAGNAPPPHEASR